MKKPYYQVLSYVSNYLRLNGEIAVFGNYNRKEEKDFDIDEPSTNWGSTIEAVDCYNRLITGHSFIYSTEMSFFENSQGYPLTEVNVSIPTPLIPAEAY